MNARFAVNYLVQTKAIVVCIALLGVFLVRPCKKDKIVLRYKQVAKWCD